MPQSSPALQEGQRRTQTRIRVQIPIKVIIPGIAEPVTALNEDISWGGALFVIANPLPEGTDLLRIVLPWKKDDQITAEARFLRSRTLENGRYLIAVRFVSLSPRSQSRLEKLLNMLGAGAKANDGGSGGLVKELEITVHDTEELRDLLAQITEGRYTVTVFDAYEADQSIRLSITGTNDLPGIRLRTRVAAVEKSHAKGFEWADLYTLTLEFEHPRKSLKALAGLLLNQLSETKDESNFGYSEIPSWVRTATPPIAQTRTLTRQAQAPAGPKNPIRCELETVFPEALNHVTAGWGDPDAFYELFQSLIMGDYGPPGGWPTEAWKELEFLQSVHDRAYGLTKTRKNPLKDGRLS